MRARRLACLAQCKPAPGDLDVNISFGPTGELLQHLVFADHVGDWRVDVVVPAGRSLRHRHLTATLQAHEVAMPKDMLEDLVVSPEPAAFESRLGTRSVELCALEERGVLSGPQELGRVHIGSDRRPSLDLDDPRVDGLATKAPRDRDPTVPVDDVVTLAYFVHVDRRQLVAFDHLPVQTRPPVPQPSRNGEKAGVEVARLGRWGGRADDRIERDLMHTAERPALCSRCREDRIQRREPPRAAGDCRAQRLPESTEACCIEVLYGTYLFQTVRRCLGTG